MATTNATARRVPRGWRIWTVAGAIALLAGCVSQPGQPGQSGAQNGTDRPGWLDAWRAPSLAALQQMCGAQPVDYGPDASSVHAAVYDAYVASRHKRLPRDAFCGFQAALAQHYAAFAASRDPQARDQWVAYFNAQRAAALDWRAAVDPTLRGG